MSDELTQRETLMCIGGPLGTQRISFPTGLQWFAVAADAAAPPPSDEQLPRLEDLVGVGEASSEPWSSEVPAPPGSVIYERAQFVSGEKGLAHVFRCRPNSK